MKLKLDENLPAGLADALTKLGDDVHTGLMEGLSGASDFDLWEAAQRESRLLRTQDLDFSDVRRFAPGTHCGLVLVRLSSPGRSALTLRMQNIFETEDVETWKGCFVVVSDIKLRIRRPKN
jgi:hypothetical protein